MVPFLKSLQTLSFIASFSINNSLESFVMDVDEDLYFLCLLLGKKCPGSLDSWGCLARPANLRSPLSQ